MTVTTVQPALGWSGRPAFIPSLGQIRVVVEATDGGQVRVGTSTHSTDVSDAPDAVVLPIIGETVTLDDFTGVWLGIVPGDLASGQVRAWVLVGTVVREVSRPATRWSVSESVTGPANPDGLPSLVALASALEQAHLLRGDLQRQQSAHARWRAGLVEDLHAEADRRDFCSDFDDWMADHDLPGRSRDWEVAVDVTKRVYVTVAASCAEDACSAVDSFMVREALRCADVDDDDWETDEDDTERS